MIQRKKDRLMEDLNHSRKIYDVARMLTEHNKNYKIEFLLKYDALHIYFGATILLSIIAMLSIFICSQFIGFVEPPEILFIYFLFVMLLVLSVLSLIIERVQREAFVYAKIVSSYNKFDAYQLEFLYRELKNFFDSLDK